MAARWLRTFLPPLIAVAICLLGAMLMLSWLRFGRDEGQTFWEGIHRIVSVVWARSLLPGRNYRFWIQSLLSATPIAMTGLAVAVAFRASVLNIGGEGQYIAGAIAATVVGLWWHVPATVLLPAVLIAAIVAGAIFAAIAAVLANWRNVPVVLSTLLLNFVGVVLLNSLLQGALHEPGQQLQSEQLPDAARLPHVFIAGIRTQLHAGFFIALACAIVLALLLRFTTFGFRLRATGENPIAARFAGIDTARVSFITLALSGGLAGLAGGIQIAGVPPYLLLPDTASSGFGFTGIAVALLGRLSPIGVVIAALFFGWLQAAFSGLETELRVPFVTLQATQGAILIALLILTSPRWMSHLFGVRPLGRLLFARSKSD